MGLQAGAGPQVRSWLRCLRLKLPLEDGLVLFRDLRGGALALELQPRAIDSLDAEGQGAFFAGLEDLLGQQAGGRPPWVLQFFLEKGADDLRLPPLCDAPQALQDSGGAAGAPPRARHPRQARLWRRHEEAFLRRAAGGQSAPPKRRLRLLLYREPAPGGSPGGEAWDEELQLLGSGLCRALEQLGVAARPLQPAEVLGWLAGWLAPGGHGDGGGEGRQLPQAIPASIDALYDAGGGWDLARELLGGCEARTEDTPYGPWCLGRARHGFLAVESLPRPPPAQGLLLDGLQTGGSLAPAVWDSLAPGTVWTVQVALEEAEDLLRQIGRARASAAGGGAAARRYQSDCEVAERLIASGEPLRRVSAGLYLRAASRDHYRDQAERALAAFRTAGVALIPPSHEAFGADAFVQHLPGNFDLAGDRTPLRRRSRLWHQRHLARLLPAAGRSSGMDCGAVQLFNRGGERLQLDPLAPHGREQNAHSLVLGPTGSGKTALLIQLFLQLCSAHRPRLYLITTLPTFGLLGQYLQRCGLRVCHLLLRGDGQVGLPPFAAAAGRTAADPSGELETMAALMVQSGEGAPLGPWERQLLHRAILEAMPPGAGQGPSVSQVVARLQAMAADQSLIPGHRSRIVEMAAAMSRFTTGVAGRIFNHPGTPLEPADCTILELGVAARRGNEHMRALAYVGLLSRVHDLIERNPEPGRQTLVVTDEAHVVLRDPMLVPYLLDITAQWRTWGAWKWLATQSLRQFPDSARDILNLSEWWWVLGPGKDEIDQIGHFRELGQHDRAAMASLRKVRGHYAEAAVFTRKFGTLIARVVASPLALALAQSEQHERAARLQLAQERGFGGDLAELAGVYLTARQIARSRAKK